MEIYAALVLTVVGMGVFILAALISRLFDWFINFWTSEE